MEKSDSIDTTRAFSYFPTMFEVKKLLSAWLMPLPFCLVLLVLGLWFICFSRNVNFGRFLLICGVIFLLLFSNRFVSTWLLRPLETTFPPVPEFTATTHLPAELAECTAIVVLGGGNGDAAGMAAVDRLSHSSRSRVVEGVRLARALPNAKLIFTGGGATKDQPSHAAVQAEAAISLGIEPGRIARIETARDTEEEAEALSRMLGEQKFALVTSAWHLRRATALMRGRGLRPLPCPCDYLSRPNEPLTWRSFTWDTESLGRSTWAIYERLGYYWSRSRGKI